MKLEKWRIKNNLSYENLARLLDFTTSKVYRICNDTSCTKLVDAYKVMERTNGEVTLTDLLPLEGYC